uniref:Uncharacterized protein n=1 Tax=Plectus sambesii TaxID=2011161 RepID=A0A914W8P3_9BILA
MSSKMIIIALMVLVAIATAAPSKGGVLPASPVKTIATAVDNHGNSAVQEANCVSQPTEFLCVFCHCAWVNGQCTGTTSTC